MVDHTHLKLPLKGTQTESRILALRIDGSAVTTSAAATGLLEGGGDVTILKGSGGSSNEVTIAFRTNFGRVPVVVATPITDDCAVRIKSVSASQVVLETVENDANASGVDDADLHVIIMGWDSATQY